MDETVCAEDVDSETEETNLPDDDVNMINNDEFVIDVKDTTVDRNSVEVQTKYAPGSESVPGLEQVLTVGSNECSKNSSPSRNPPKRMRGSAVDGMRAYWNSLQPQSQPFNSDEVSEKESESSTEHQQRDLSAVGEELPPEDGSGKRYRRFTIAY